MKSTYKIVWSDESLKNLQNIISYLEEEWTQKEIRKFARLLDKRLDILKDNPFSFQESDKSKAIRKMVLTKLISIFYSVEESRIYLITLFDCRQNPDKLKFSNNSD